ncbi:MAG: ribonuclease III [Clostridiales bacterium]|jgi:ribonuclease-3 family protein|nr:ribonuclease III [Clostridiales bacterium]
MKLEEYSPLSLAFLGDAVFELYVRSMVVSGKTDNVDVMHKKSKAYVNASSQRQMYFRIYSLLEPDEQAVLKRGRNSKTHSRAKSASASDYQHATGLETLFGYLFLKGDKPRLDEIFRICTADRLED